MLIDVNDELQTDFVFMKTRLLKSLNSKKVLRISMNNKPNFALVSWQNNSKLKHAKRIQQYLT